MELTGQARGKLLLFGEHAVVYGHPALGFSLPLATRVLLDDTPGTGCAEDTALVNRLVQRWDPGQREIWHQRAWAARIQSTVPMGCGFGSSAALTGALARAWSQALPSAAGDDLLRELAHQAEHEFHGRPSGVDTALALGCGLTAFTPQGDDRPCIRSLTGAPCALVTGSLPRKSDAKTLIAGIHGQRDRQPRITRQRLAQLGDLAARAIAQFETPVPGSVAVLGRFARDAQAILGQLGLSTPQLDTILQRGQEAGACGGKLSGAGGGGAFVLFCSGPDDAARVVRTLAREFPAVCSNLQDYHWNGRELAASA